MRARFVGSVVSIVSIVGCASGTDTSGSGGATSTGSTTTTSSSSTGSTSSTTSSTSSTSSTTTSSTSSTSTTSGTTTSSTGTGGMGTGTPCHWNKVDPCGPGMYCEALGCGDGMCRPLGQAETQDRAPVCGCDGVTYWNSFVAETHGMAIQASGACSPAKPCGGLAGLPCPEGAQCNYKLNDKSECNISDQGGTCWAIPSECSQIVVGPTQHACQSISCTDECNLIKLATPWYEDPTCPQ